MVAITMHLGSHMQLQEDSPVFMRIDNKGVYIGNKADSTLAIGFSLSIEKKDGHVVNLSNQIARCCFGFYEIDYG